MNKSGDSLTKGDCRCFHVRLCLQPSAWRTTRLLRGRSCVQTLGSCAVLATTKRTADHARVSLAAVSDATQWLR